MAPFEDKRENVSRNTFSTSTFNASHDDSTTESKNRATWKVSTPRPNR